MNKEIADAWATALESEEFKQGKEALRSADDHFCCLGVLCKLHQRANPDKGTWVADKDGVGSYTYDTSPLNLTPDRHSELDYSEGVITEEVKRWSGSARISPVVPMKEDCETSISLATLNDNGKSFKEIAALIRLHWAIL